MLLKQMNAILKILSLLVGVFQSFSVQKSSDNLKSAPYCVELASYMNSPHRTKLNYEKPCQTTLLITTKESADKGSTPFLLHCFVAEIDGQKIIKYGFNSFLHNNVV